jgi:hypothetical protein
VDDVVKISRNVEALEEALQELDNKAHQTEVTINQEKTKYMRVRRHNQCQRIAIGGYRFERISHISLFSFSNK